MRFKLDENLPLAVRDALNAAGHDVATVHEQQLAGSPDARLLAVCRDEGRALVSADRGLGDPRRYRPADYAGIVVLRPALQGVSAMVRLVDRLLPLLEREVVAGRLWIVTEQRVRIRGA